MLRVIENKFLESRLCCNGVGGPVARSIPESKGAACKSFDFDALAAFVDSQRMAAGNSVVDMRAQAKFGNEFTSA